MRFSLCVLRTTAWLLLALDLFACTSPPEIRTQADPAANFAAYQTYNFYPQSQYLTFIDTYLRNAISRELETRGYRRAENPDLLVNFNLLTKEKIQVTQSPDAYYGFRTGYYYGGMGGFGTTTDVNYYTEGTLTVDLVDAAKKQLAWSGVAVGLIRDKARDNPQAAADSVITSMFAKYPYRASAP